MYFVFATPVVRYCQVNEMLYQTRSSCSCQTNTFVGLMLINQHSHRLYDTVCLQRFWTNHNSCCVCCVSSGGSSDKGQNDGVRHHHGQLPAARRQGQLFPHGDLKPRCYLRGHRLSYRGDRTTRPRSIRLHQALLCVSRWGVNCLSWMYW